MQRPLLGAALVAMLPIAALAGGPTTVQPEPPMTPPAATIAAVDWSGAYAGLAAGRANGDMQYFVYDAPDTREAVDGSLTGAFVGFNIQRGNLVYGGELAYSKGDVEYDNGYGFTSFLDLKGKLGYASQKTLVYAVLGVTRGEWTEEGFDSISGTGMAYGAGLDFAVSDRMTIGVEYLWRNFDTGNFASAVPQIANTNVEGDFGTLSLRVAFRF